MALTIREDIVYGSGYNLTTDGPEAVRVFIVEASEGETYIDVLTSAGVAPTSPTIPELFEEYPVVASPSPYPTIYALDVKCQAIDENNNRFRVTVTYGLPEPFQKQAGLTAADAIIQVGSSLSGSKTSVDKDGNRITVSLSTEADDQVGEIDIQVPEMVLQFERRESANPRAKALTYVGKVNSASLDTGTYAARTLLCLGIDGTSVDDGRTWTVTYRFQYRPNTWAATAVYTDDQGRPHKDINLAVSPYDGAKSVNIYSEADFDNLDLF